MRDQVLCGDAREALLDIETASMDAVVTDPPYALTDRTGGTRGFMGAAWDTGMVAHSVDFWCEVLRVAKPGAFLIAFGGTRTYHRLTCAIEDAGWECRDMLNWLFASGFPKSKSCLKPAHEPILLAKAPGPLQPLQIDACRVPTAEIGSPRAYEPRQDREQWRITGGSNGSGATSPAGRWPSNLVLSHVGGPGGCRPAGVQRVRGIGGGTRGNGHIYGNGAGLTANPGAVPVAHYADAEGYEDVQSWECVDGCPVKALDEQAGPRTSGGFRGTVQRARHNRSKGAERQRLRADRGTETGSASRFFPTFDGAPESEDAVPFMYCAKASRSERNAGCHDLPYERPGVLADDSYVRAPDGKAGDTTRTIRGNVHPCVKPLALMQWLVALVARPGHLIIDPFCGSGSTLVACVREGMHFIGIDQDEQYCAIARRRVAYEQEQQAGQLFAGVRAGGP